jgi:hypothetical protein
MDAFCAASNQAPRRDQLEDPPYDLAFPLLTGDSMKGHGSRARPAEKWCSRARHSSLTVVRTETAVFHYLFRDTLREPANFVLPVTYRSVVRAMRLHRVSARPPQCAASGGVPGRAPRQWQRGMRRPNFRAQAAIRLYRRRARTRAADRTVSLDVPSREQLLDDHCRSPLSS